MTTPREFSRRTMSERLVRKFIDADRPTSLAASARMRRWQQFISLFPDLDEMHVLDLGGDPAFWRSVPVKPNNVTLVNLIGFVADEPWMRVVVGDACAPPAHVFNSRWDLVFSNSLIEHLGGPSNRARFAAIVDGASERYWVQTPYRYFPIEPHWLFPGLQFLPLPLRATVIAKWPLSPTKQESVTRSDALEFATMVDLLGVAELRYLFPDGRLWCERFAGLIKSITAYRV